MKVCIFNPEHDLCLANGSPNYLPPHSAIDFARRDANLMATLYPGACCCSVYDSDMPLLLNAENNPTLIAWGWNQVLRQQLLRLGVDETLIPTQHQIEEIRRLQHRATLLPLQPDCRIIRSDNELAALLQRGEPIVLKAPWSGAGRGLRWLRSECKPKDWEWLHKILLQQGCVVAEPWRQVDANLALEYLYGTFYGYSLFHTQAGVYRQNQLLPDNEIAALFAHTDLQSVRSRIERWLQDSVWSYYSGPLGVDLMLVGSHFYIAEMNLRHTMGMVAHAQIKQNS